MKLVPFFALLGLSAFVMSCEPIDVDDTNFNPDPNDTTYTAGFSVSMKTASGITSFNSRGVGFMCADTMGTFWGLATGDSVQYDPMMQAIYSTSATDTVLGLMFQSVTSGVGVYTPVATPFGPSALCFMETPSSFTEYDASLLTVNITKVTTDSIYGMYFGPLQEMTWVIDSTGNFVPNYTGTVDTVTASFGVLRAPC